MIEWMELGRQVVERSACGRHGRFWYEVIQYEDDDRPEWHLWVDTDTPWMAVIEGGSAESFDQAKSAAEAALAKHWGGMG